MSFLEEIVAEARRDRAAALARVRQLRDWRSERAVEVLATLFKAPMGYIRAEAAQALSANPSDEAVRVLVAVLKKDRDWHVRSAALKALASIGSAAAVEAIEAAQNDKAFGVREDARAALGSLSERPGGRVDQPKGTHRELGSDKKSGRR